MIAWVYPTLENVTDDIRMSVRVANYVTPTGDRPDGLATDIEEVMDSGSVYTYGQVMRALLGPNELMVNSAMHPFTHASYPYAAIAASWNVMAPMNYWHSSASHDLYRRGCRALCEDLGGHDPRGDAGRWRLLADSGRGARPDVRYVLR